MRTTTSRMAILPLATLMLICAARVVGTCQEPAFKPSIAYSKRVLSSFQQAPGSEQGPERGNCASIALIKAAISTFGPDAVFRTLKHENGVYTITLRNGQLVSLTDEEDRLAEAESGFTLPTVGGVAAGDPVLMKEANFAWAVMAKRRTQEIQDSDVNILDGAMLLNEGDDVRYIARLLGLDVLRIKRSRSVSYMHANGYHAVFAAKDEYDDYGSPAALGVVLHDHVGLNPLRDFESYNLQLVDVAPIG